jgi:DNA polymerase alpha subunit A
MNKKSKREALEKLRARREGRLLSSRTEEFEVKENDVYEQMDEDEYQKLVEARREREDFVVDDGKSNHCEERLFEFKVSCFGRTYH